MTEESSLDQYEDTLLAALVKFSRGEPFESGIGIERHGLLHYGLIESVSVGKPCKSCGHTLIDYTRDRITPTGKLLLHALQSSPEVHTSGE